MAKKTDSKLQSKWERQQRESQRRQRESLQQQLLSQQRAQRQLALEEQPPPEGFTLKHILQGHKGKITGIVWSPDGRLLAFSVGSVINIWDMKGGSSPSKILSHSNFVTAMAWSPDGRQLVSSSADRVVYLWDVESDFSLSIYKGYGKAVTNIAWSPDGRLLAFSFAKETFIFGKWAVMRSPSLIAPLISLLLNEALLVGALRGMLFPLR